jgi:probable lipoprotein (TIGR04455 family)
MPSTRSWLGAVALLFAACGPVEHVHVRPDYDLTDRSRTFRVVVVTSPLPAGNATVGELWSLIARRYVNQHRDFIVARHLAGPALPEEICAERAEAVLWLKPSVGRARSQVWAAVQAKLWRCSDLKSIWEATAKGRWKESDPAVRELTARYQEELGPAVVAYVPATFHLLRETLDTLPYPRLVREEDVMEKIELGE